MSKKKKKSIGVSTAIISDNCLTFGSGRLDDYGFWQYPNAKAARNNEIKDGVPINTYWPFDPNHPKRY